MSYESFVQNQEENIARTGLSIVGVLDSPSFSYSVGLTDRGWPELIIIGVGPEVAMHLINIVSMGPKPELGDILHNAANFPLRIGAVSDAALEERMVQAIARQDRVGGARPVALQIIYPDANGIFPNEEGYALDPRVQPILAPPLN